MTRVPTRTCLGLAAAAATTAALGFTQPIGTHLADAFTWHDSGYCGSSDGGDEWWYVQGWAMWWTASAVLLGVLAWTAVTRPDFGDGARPQVAAYVRRYAAATVVAVATALVGVRTALGYLFGLMPERCREPADLTGQMITGVVSALVAVALLAVLPEVRAALLLGWAWVWLLNANTWIRSLGGDRGIETVGETRAGGFGGGHDEPVLSVAVLVGYLLVLPGLSWLYAWRRTGRPARALASAAAVNFLAFLAYFFAATGRF